MRMPVRSAALLAQAGAVLLAWLIFETAAFFGLLLPLWAIAATQSAAAVLLSRLLRLPVWWLPVQALFIPAVLFALHLDLPSGYFLTGFVLFWLIFRSNARERVPLYFSSQATAEALLALLPPNRPVAFLDLGSGLGGLPAYLAAHRPDSVFHGVESAPALFGISWLRLRKRTNAQVRYGSLWQENLAPYDLVYAFLSPEPMPELWRKAKAEMRPGSLLVSNSFTVPGMTPIRTLSLNDTRRTRLLIWTL